MSTQLSEKGKKLIQLATKIAMVQADPKQVGAPEVFLMDEIEKVDTDLQDFKKETDKNFNETEGKIEEVKRSVEEVAKLEGPKGDAGETPTDEHLTELITPLIPPAIKGEKGDQGSKPVAGIDYPIPQNGQDGEKGDQGEPADEQMIMSLLLATIADNFPVLAEKFRDGLELLQGKERLSMSAVDGLTEALEEIKKAASQRYGGIAPAYFDFTLRENIVPTGAIDGSNKTFVLPDTPKSGTLRPFADGARQQITTDYTLSGVMITFIVAPNTSVVCDYRV